MSASGTSAPRATWLQHGALWGFVAFQWLLGRFPMRFWSRIGRGVGHVVWLLFASRRRIVERNLRIILGGHLRHRELAPMVRENIVRTCMNFLSAAKIAVMTDDQLREAVHLEGPGAFEHAGMEGRTAIACIPHAGNWEILARIRPFFPRVKRYGSMYRRMSNPLLEKLVYRLRTAYGCEMFSKEDGLRSTLKMAKEGGLIGVLSDQYTQEGAFLPYFGKITGTTYLPALLYKRCRSGTLFSVFTRNTSLGHWDAVMNRPIDLPDPDANIYELTLTVNEALARCQQESILDGFWMHDRWKVPSVFAPQQTPEVNELLKRCQLKPFRVLIAVPRRFEEALLTVPLMRALRAARRDIQLTVACPREQADFWRKQKEPSHVATVDDPALPFRTQLESDTIYNDGPFDLAILLDNRKDTWKTIDKLAYIRYSGFDDHPCARKRHFYTVSALAHNGGPRHQVEHYLDLMRRHCIPCSNPAFFAPLTTEVPAGREPRVYLAPFSSLGPASEWNEEGWKKLISLLPMRPSLLALQEDKSRAAALATSLGIPCCTAAPADLDALVFPGDTVIAADGLVPNLASHLGARCIVLMSARLPACYRPLGTRHAVVNCHRACHPCYRERCDRETPCLHGVEAEQIASLLQR